MKKILYLVLSLLLWGNCASKSLQLGQEKSVACAPCHGPAGVSANPTWPNLAGQHADYLLKQLRDFKEGQLRHAELMAPFIASLTEDEMASLALFYAKQSPARAAPVTHDNDRGATLYRAGDVEKKITACIACHGPQGTGNEDAGFPSLIAQHAPYAVLQLQAFQAKIRRNDRSGIMQSISAHMSADDMAAVTNYLASLSSPTRRPEDL